MKKFRVTITVEDLSERSPHRSIVPVATQVSIREKIGDTYQEERMQLCRGERFTREFVVESETHESIRSLSREIFVY